jgi:alkylation response protein AidB-like acyl-CoA dehydrogenase
VLHDLVLYETDNFADSLVVQEASWAFGGYTACYLGVGLAIVDWVANQLRTRKAKGYAQVMGYAPESSHRLGEMVTEIEAARLMVYRAA